MRTIFLSLLFFTFASVGFGAETASSKASAVRAPASGDFAKRFILRCPITAGQYEVTTPPAKRREAAINTQPNGTSMSIDQGWRLNASTDDPNEKTVVRLEHLYDHFDNSLNMPECYFEKNVRYVLDPEILKRYSCMAHSESKVFICDRVD